MAILTAAMQGRPSWQAIVIGGLAAAAVIVSGCSRPGGPFAADDRDASFSRAIEQAVDQELAAESIDQQVSMPRDVEPTEVQQQLQPRIDELEAIGPYSRTQRDLYRVGADLSGVEQQTFDVTLEQAVSRALEHNLALQGQRLQPAISQLDLVAAEAFFDVLSFGNVDFAKIDEPSTVPIINGVPIGTPFDQNERYRFETGLRKPLYSGGAVSLSTDLTRFRNLSPGISFSPDPAYTAAVRLGYDQPLLRGFGSDVNRTSIRLAANQTQRSIQELRQEMLRVIADVEVAYWNLVFAWHDLAIRQWLVDEGISIRDKLQVRLEAEVDVAGPQYTDAVARVAQREADVIRAQRALRQASDRLKLLLSDPELNIASEVLLLPADEVQVTPITIDPRDAMMTAIRNRPEVIAAMYDIDDARLRELVADNARLPLLNLSAELAYFGLEERPGNAYEEVSDSEFIDYVAGLAFEFPLGNREADALYRQARLQRSAALIGYRRALQTTVAEVKDALLDVLTNHSLISATRSFRLAQAENLRALRAQQPLAGMTPEFLNLRFQRQEALAQARREELQALVNYDQAIAELYRALGTGLDMKGIDVEIELPSN